MTQRAAKAVKLPDENDVEPSALCIRHQSVEFGRGIRRAAHTLVNVFGGKVPAASLRELSEIPCLEAHILTVVGCTDSGVDRNTGAHRLAAFGFGPGVCAAFTLRPLAISASLQ